MSDIGSERCPFEIQCHDDRKLTDAIRTSNPRQSHFLNLEEDQMQFPLASKSSFSQPDFVEPGPQVIVEDKDEESKDVQIFSSNDPKKNHDDQPNEKNKTS